MMNQSSPKKPKRKRKPRFVRKGGNHMKRLGEKWRKPRGIDSKMRASIFGKPKRPKVGYGNDRRVRSIHPSGYREILVSNPNDLEPLNSSTQAARISRNVGLLKREKILVRANELGIKILNR